MFSPRPGCALLGDATVGPLDFGFIDAVLRNRAVDTMVVQPTISANGFRHLHAHNDDPKTLRRGGVALEAVSQ